MDDAEAMRAAMLVRQPSLKSIKTKVERHALLAAEERGAGSLDDHARWKREVSSARKSDREGCEL